MINLHPQVPGHPQWRERIKLFPSVS